MWITLGLRPGAVLLSIRLAIRWRSARCIAVLLPAVACTGAAWAEGAARTLECGIVRACDPAGHCRPGDGRVTFRWEPVAVDADGAGRYTLRYRDVEAEMAASSAAGPFVWTTAHERHALLASSETEFLWHALTLEPAPAAEIRFLSCVFRQ